MTIETNIYDKTTYVFDCALQILENTVTGEISIGWTPMNSDLAAEWMERDTDE